MFSLFVVCIGTGTFGRVYLAKCSKNDHYHAIKVLKKTEIVRLKQVEHINSERLVLSKVNFPFIVDLYVSIPATAYHTHVLPLCLAGTVRFKMQIICICFKNTSLVESSFHI